MKNPCKILIKILLILLFISFPGILIADQWTTYSRSDGLPDNSIWSIVEDQKGYLWFVTAFNGVSRYDGVRFKNYNETNGLISNNIYFSLADHSGNVWFVSDRGLTIFDGINFTSYDTSNGLPSNNISYIYEDSKSHLWFAADSGVFKFMDNNFTDLINIKDFNYKYISSIVEDKNGILWFGTESGICKYDGTDCHEIMSLTSSTGNKTMYCDNSNNLWIGSENGLYYKSAESLRIDGPILRNNIVKIYEDSDSQIWILTQDKNLLKFDSTQNSFSPINKSLNSQPLCFIEDGLKNIWIGSIQGIHKYDRKNLENYVTINDFPVSYARCILIDSDANLWFATEKGALKYTMQNLEHFSTKTGLNDNRINGILEDSAGNLWFGTDKGLNIFDGYSFSSVGDKCQIVYLFKDSRNNFWYSTTDGLYRNFERISSIDRNLDLVRSIKEDSKGNIWLAVPDGIIKFNEVKSKYFQIEDSQNIFIDSLDKVWVSTLNDGLYIIHPDSEIEHISTENGFPCNSISWFFETHDGKIWIGLKHNIFDQQQAGASSGGVCCYYNSTFNHYSTEDGLSSNSISDVLEDKNGNIWFTTEKGINIYEALVNDNDFSVSKLTTAEGLISNYVTSLTVDKEGNLWFCTDKGISKFDGKNFQNIILDGYLSFGVFKEIYEDRDNNLWLLTTNDGVIRYLQPSLDIRPRIEIVKLDADKIINRNSGIKIPISSQKIMIEYKGISFITNPGMIRYTYMLQGFEDSYQPAVYRNRAVYSDLKPGDYVFSVMAIDKDLHLSDPPATIEFTVYQPFYKSIIFILTASISSIILILSFLNSLIQLHNQRKLSREYQEKLRLHNEAEKIQAAKMVSLRQLIAGVAHEINTPLGAVSSNNQVFESGVKNLQKIIENEAPDIITNNKKLQKTFSILTGLNSTSGIAINRISSIVTNLRSFVGLDEAEYQLADIHEGLESVLTLVDAPNKNKVNVIKNYSEIPEFYCSPSTLNQLFMIIIKNAYEAIKDRGNIRINTFTDDSYICVEIKDDGIGIPEENMSKIFDPGFTTKGVKVGVGLGLSIAYRIINDEYSGKIDVSSKQNNGSTFTISLKPVSKKNHR